MGSCVCLIHPKVVQELRHSVPQHTLLNIYRALFILWFDSLGTGVKNTFSKNLIAPEKSSPFHIFSQQES